MIAAVSVLSTWSLNRTRRTSAPNSSSAQPPSGPTATTTSAPASSSAPRASAATKSPRSARSHQDSSIVVTHERRLCSRAPAIQAKDLSGRGGLPCPNLVRIQRICHAPSSVHFSTSQRCRSFECGGATAIVTLTGGGWATSTPRWTAPACQTPDPTVPAPSVYETADPRSKRNTVSRCRWCSEPRGIEELSHGPGTRRCGTCGTGAFRASGACWTASHHGAQRTG